MRPASAAPRDLSALRFDVPQHNGTRVELDLTELAVGVDALARGRKYLFTGRPPLAMDFVEPLQAYALTVSPQTLRSVKHALRLLWRFLDASPHLAVSSISALSEVHGTALTLWLPQAHAAEGTYRQLKTLVQFARRYHNLPELFWPTIHDRDDSIGARDLEPPSILAVFKALLLEAQAIKAMLREGNALASQGRDPRGSRIGAGSSPKRSGWHQRENHAWLVKALAVPTIVDKETFYRNRAHGLNKSNYPERQQHPGPTYLAPGQSPRATEGIVGKLRWFYPSLGDTIVFFLLFMLTTGWNESTALGLDISGDDWATTHWLQPKLKILKSFKPRSRSYQYAVALENSQWRPYQLVLYMMQITQGLRNRLLLDIADLREQIRIAPSPALQHKLADLLIRSRSPWLFHSLDNAGEVVALNASFNTHVNLALAALIERHDIRDSRGRLCAFTLSDWRNAFAAHADETSGVFGARAALNHASDVTIDRYLNQPRLRRRAYEQIRVLIRSAVSEIHAGHTVDGTTLRVLVAQGSITEQQRARIADSKNRSRVGMGCPAL